MFSCGNSQNRRDFRNIIPKNHRNTNISLLIRRIVRNFATRWHCGVCQRIFVYESVRLLCERGGITVRGSVGQRNKKQTTFIISVLCSQNTLCLMAMRHLWCACTKFQPNPALRRALSRSQSSNGSRKTTRIIPSVSNNQILKAMRKSFVYAAGLMCLALSITDCQKELVD